MKILNACRKFGAKAALLPAVTLALATQAYAEVPESVKTELQGAKGDVTEVGGIILGVFVTIFVLMIIRRMFR